MFKLFAITVFVVGLISVSLNFGSQYLAMANTPPNRDIKVSYESKFFPANGAPAILENRVYRLQKADGSWKETITYFSPDGVARKTTVTYGINGRGVFTVSEKQKTLYYLANRPQIIPQFSEVGYRANQNFVGESMVAGYRTLIQRSKYDENETNEYYNAPDLNGVSLKTVDLFAVGTRIQEAIEAKAELITNEEFGDLPNYPINYGPYQNQQAAINKAKKKP